MNIIDINSKDNKKGMTEADAVQAIVEASELEAQKPARFLTAWKRGIRLAGGNFFKLQVHIDKATDRDQLRPNYEVIQHSLKAISTGQAHFLALMYSFYNSEDGQKMLEAIGRPSITDAASYQDKQQLAIVIELMQNYHGW